VIDPSAVDAALDRVVDPCSNALGEPLGLREMGLASSVEIDDVHGDVHVTMRLTSPCCAYGPAMAVAAEREIGGVAGVRRATVVIDHAAVWTPTEITAPATLRLAGRRRHTIEVTGVVPYDWTTRSRASEPLRPSTPGGTS
jgi:metal-sulfur cluster biosynthetic enzyme